jgi:hypothetical protein
MRVLGNMGLCVGFPKLMRRLLLPLIMMELEKNVVVSLIMVKW